MRWKKNIYYLNILFSLLMKSQPFYNVFKSNYWRTWRHNNDKQTPDCDQNSFDYLKIDKRFPDYEIYLAYAENKAGHEDVRLTFHGAVQE